MENLRDANKVYDGYVELSKAANRPVDLPLFNFVRFLLLTLEVRSVDDVFRSSTVHSLKILITLTLLFVGCSWLDHSATRCPSSSSSRSGTRPRSLVTRRFAA